MEANKGPQPNPY
jgi:aconitate hydratase